MTQSEFLTHLQGVRRAGRGYVALCPAHEDKNPSLSVSAGEDGRILLKCHAGCSTEEVVAALGLTVKDLFGEVTHHPKYPAPHRSQSAAGVPPRSDMQSPQSGVCHPPQASHCTAVCNPPKAVSPPSRKVVATYDYGFAKKVRYEPKSFAWFRPRSGWSVAEESALPYHEQDWLAGRGNHPKTLYAPRGFHDYILIVEGEKDADRLSASGLYAVSPEDGAGAGKWVESYTQALTAAGVAHAFVCPDHDTVGEDFAAEIATSLRRSGIATAILPLAEAWQNPPDHADWSDYAETFGETAMIKALCSLMTSPNHTPAAQSPASPAPNPPQAAFPGVLFASEFGEDNTTFLWYPYLPIGEYTVLMADGGTGKTMLACALAAAFSRGAPLPGQLTCTSPTNTLILSAEDKGEILRARLEAADADLSRIAIIDCAHAEGFDLTDHLSALSAAVEQVGAGLLVVDPWHAFVGADTNINQINTLRPILAGVAAMAKERGCAVILISHVNKKAQGENANNAAAGSVDFINAARSALRVAFESNAESPYRLMVHTKSNYAPYGKTVRYAIETPEEGGSPTVRFAGFSDITRETLETAARRHTTPSALVREEAESEGWKNRLRDAVCELAREAESLPLRVSYADVTERFGEEVFGGRQPKRALEAVREELEAEGVRVETGVYMKIGNRSVRGFTVS